MTIPTSFLLKLASRRLRINLSVAASFVVLLLITPLLLALPLPGPLLFLLAAATMVASGVYVFKILSRLTPIPVKNSQ